jgi:hypothetical protein
MQIRKKRDEIKKKSSPLKLLSNLGIFWLKIEQFWPFEDISIFSNGGHLGYRTALTDTNLKGELVSVSAVLYPRWPPLIKIEISSNGQNCSILSQKVLKFESSFRGEDFFLISSPPFFNFIIGQNR